MRLTRLSMASIAGCLLGLALLLLVSLDSAQRLREQQAVLAGLFELQARIHDFSAASDSLLLLGADSSLRAAYVNEAEALQARLRALGASYPDAHEAARRVGQMRDRVMAQIGGGAAGLAMDGREGMGPLSLPPRARILMSQVVGHGIALETALDDVLRERRETLARDVAWVGGTLTGVALLFGALCMTAFGLIHRRVAAPARSVARTLERIAAGDAGARAAVGGRDELARLAATLNRVLDQREAADARARAQQGELERRAQMLADSQRIAGVGSWQLRLADGTLEWSAETYRIAGVDPDRFTPTPAAFFALVHPDDRDRLLATHDAVLQGAARHEAEFRIVRADGAVRHVQERAERRCDPGDGSTVMAGTIQDITQIRRLDERARQFMELVEGSEDLCGIADADHRFVWVNRAYTERYGLQRASIEGRPLREVLGAAYFDEVARPRLERCLAGEPQRFETERDLPGLGRRRLLARYHPIEVPGAADRRVGAVITDITEIRAAQAELDRQARLLAMAGRAARFGAWSVDLDNGQIEWSDVVAEIHAMPAGHSPGLEEGISFYVPEHRERVRTVFTACAEAGEPYDEELQIVDARGERRWVRVVGEPVRDAGGRIVAVQGAFQDISARKEAEHEAERLADRLATMLETVAEGFVAVGRDWRYTYVNAAAARLLGRDRTALLGSVIWEQFPELAGTAIGRALRRTLAEGIPQAVEEYFPLLESWFEVRAYPWEEGIAIFFQDVGDRHIMIERLHQQEEHLRLSHKQLAELLDLRNALIDALPAHIALLDAAGRIVDVNDQWCHFGRENAYPGEGFGIGENYLEVCEAAHAQGAEQGGAVAAGLGAVLAGDRQSFALEYPCHAPSQERWFRVMANRLAAGGSEGSGRGAVVMHIDITERKLAERELNRLAYEDRLTGLASRHGFAEALRNALGAGEWEPEALLIVLNLRRLRDVNDAYGYAVGDQLLIEVARRLRRWAGAGAIVGRVGADEFAVFLRQPPDRGASHHVEQLRSELARPFDLQSTAVEVSGSFGISRLGERGRDAETLLREAALAMNASRAGDPGDGWLVYSDALEEEAHRRIAITGELREALREGQFRLHFQPKVMLASGELIACEALLRWAHPERGLQPPGSFIPIAEQSQLIAPIGDWAVHEACRLLRHWQDSGLEVVRVSVNVSLVQLMVGDFPATVRRALASSRVAPSALSLEITESVFTHESERLRNQLQELHEMGVRLSLDDFGTGYSSLLYLQSYPFDEIKIDQRFVRGMVTDDYSRNIVHTVLGIATALGAEVVAEGVETPQMRDALLEMGCTVGQGYYYSVPLEAERFRSLLQRRTPLPLGRAAPEGQARNRKA